MKYVVTGAAGFIGSHLAEALIAAGHDVLGIDCFTDSYDPAVKEQNARGLDVQRIDLVTGPLSFAGTDGVFHLAGHPGPARSFADFPLYLHRNVEASHRVFEAAVRDGVRVVFASSSSVYGAVNRFPTPEDTLPVPLSPYGVTKLAAEYLAAAFERSLGLEVVVLRYFSVFGPRQRPDMAFTRIARALVEECSFVLHGNGAQTRAWTYVGDAVEATIAAMAGGGGGVVYNVGGGSELPLRDAIAAFERLAGRRLTVRKQPAILGEPARTSADIRRIEADLDWRPCTNFDDGARAHWEWVLTAPR
jgi:nucleoside-diphosphate-sugar epimerase